MDATARLLGANARVRVLALARVLVLALPLGGCANFQVVSDFAQATKQVTTPIREEMAFLTATCVRQAELRSGFEMDDEFTRVAQCRGTDRALQALQQQTVVAMDLYATALQALVDDRRYDVSGEAAKVAKKLTALKDRDGTALVSDGQAGAVAKLLNLVADAYLMKEREQGIRRLVDAAPELAELGRSLNRFFVAPQGAAPYDELVRLTQAEMRVVDALLRSELVTRAEPLRAAELRVSQARLRQALRERAREGDGSVGALLAQSLQAWIDSVPVFAQQALAPDPKALRERIQHFRAKAAAAQAALDASE